MEDRKNGEGPLEDRFLTLNGAASVLGESRNGVLSRIARKELDTDYVAGRTVVTIESVGRVQKQKQEAAEKAAEPSSRKGARAQR